VGCDGLNECGQGQTRMRLAHEGFTDEEGVEAGVAEGADVGGGMNAAFSDVDGVGGKAGGEAQGSFEGDFEGAEVAVVDAVGIAAEVADAGQLVGGVNFAEDVELVLLGDGGEAG